MNKKKNRHVSKSLIDRSNAKDLKNICVVVNSVFNIGQETKDIVLFVAKLIC